MTLMPLMIGAFLLLFTALAAACMVAAAVQVEHRDWPQAAIDAALGLCAATPAVAIVMQVLP